MSIEINSSSLLSAKPSINSSIVLMLFLLLAIPISEIVDNEIDKTRVIAYLLAFGIMCLYAIEAKRNISNLFRADLFLILALYGLLYIEFLFEQSNLEVLTRIGDLEAANKLSIVAFISLLLGRHFMLPIKWSQSGKSAVTNISPRILFNVLLVCFAIAYFHKLLSVSFNPIEMIEQMSNPRFSQSWQRGKYGNLSALLNELGLLSYVIPPISGIIYASRNQFGFIQKMIVLTIFSLVLYDGFSSGTRSIFMVHLVTAVVAYVLWVGRISTKKIIMIGLAGIALVYVSSQMMLEFREHGLKRYVDRGGTVDTRVTDFFIDQNMIVLSRIVTVFPEYYDYMGTEIPVAALVRPIPRALWPGKPEGLSTSVEEALDVHQVTLATTYIGEAYISYGYIAVILFSLVLGAMASSWCRYASVSRSPWRTVVYATGFFAAGITMRSVMWLTVAILPVLFLLYIGKVYKLR